MLEKILFKYLTKKGRVNYYIGVAILIALVAFYVFGIEGASLESGQTGFLIVALILNLVWAGVCYLLWKKPKEEN